MTIPNKIIELAVKGGYKELKGSKSVSIKFHKNSYDVVTFEDGSTCGYQGGVCSSYAYDIINPRFWQSLGKQRGWDENIYENEGLCYDCGMSLFPEWKHQQHRFIDLLTGGNTDAFWAGLIDKK